MEHFLCQCADITETKSAVNVLTLLSEANIILRLIIFFDVSVATQSVCNINFLIIQEEEKEDRPV
jgi:hypothetical protein